MNLNRRFLDYPYWKIAMPLQNATDEIKLAVELILLLEQSNLSPVLVLAALDIVKQDFENKSQGLPPTNVD